MAIKDRINSRVKHRAWFRPFAPALLEERVAEFFDIDQFDPFMTMAVSALKPSVAARIRALYADIERFAALTGIPVILNTSFNNHEPIGAKARPLPATCVPKWMYSSPVTSIALENDSYSPPSDLQSSRQLSELRIDVAMGAGHSKMSALGHKRKWCHGRVMSVLPPKRTFISAVCTSA